MTDRKEAASEETTSKPSADSEALAAILAELRALKAQVNALENEKNTTPKKTPSKPTAEDFGYELYADNSDDFISGAWPKTPGENANRRQTMFEKSVGEAEDNAATLVMQGIQPKFEHIRLSYLSIGKVFEFLDAINEYEIANKIKLKVPTLVDKSVRSLIIARTRGLTESKFYALNNKQLFAYITVLVQPESKLDFKEKLERNVDFVLPPSYKPSATDYRPMYDALLIYRDRFRKVYEIMAANNEDNVPQCKNKEGGLIKTFLDKIPYEYGARVMMTLGDAKYADIYAFLKAFFDVVEDHRSFYLSAMKLRQSFGGTEYRAKRFPDAKVQGSEVLFSNIEEEQVVQSESVAEETESEEELDQLLAAMQSPQGSGKGTPACFKKVLHGSCDRPGCKFDHEESSVQKLRDHYIDSMQKLKKNVKPIIKTEQSAYGRRPGSFSNIEPDAELELSCIQEELFLANLSTDSFFRAVHREGLIKLDVADLHISKALFDTGARRSQCFGGFGHGLAQPAQLGLVNAAGLNVGHGQGQSRVGLQGSFGTVRLGRGLTPFQETSTAFEPWSGVPAVAGYQTNLQVAGYTSDPLAPPGSSGNRFSNAIWYNTPVVNGFQLNVAVAAKESLGNTTAIVGRGTALAPQYTVNSMASANPFGASATYTLNQFAAYAAYERNAIETKLWSVGASFKPMPALKLMASYQKQDMDHTIVSGAANHETDAWLVGANYTMGPGKLLLGYGQKSPDRILKTKQASIGYEYNISTRTYIYFDLSNRKMPIPATTATVNDSSVNHYSVGIHHNF
eukprot:gene23216-26282_t